MSNGKTNQFGKVQYMGTLRNRDVRLCPVGALALYLFHRWHGSGEAFPALESRRSWYLTKLLLGSPHKPQESMSYMTQLAHVNTTFDAIGLDSKAKTQAMRGCGARDAELHGVCEEQVGFSLFSIYSLSNFIGIY